MLATREREKGNEAFRVKDWDEAVAYYTRSDLTHTHCATIARVCCLCVYICIYVCVCRSLCFLPTVAGFNNRAQAEIKLQRWTDALRDCDAVLHIETHNCKGESSLPHLTSSQLI